LDPGRLVPTVFPGGWFDLIWFDLIWFDLIWFGLIWFGLAWVLWNVQVSQGRFGDI
jgi:hypothetical protein